MACANAIMVFQAIHVKLKICASHKVRNAQVFHAIKVNVCVRVFGWVIAVMNICLIDWKERLTWYFFAFEDTWHICYPSGLKWITVPEIPQVDSSFSCPIKFNNSKLSPGYLSCSIRKKTGENYPLEFSLSALGVHVHDIHFSFQCILSGDSIIGHGKYWKYDFIRGGGSYTRDCERTADFIAIKTEAL